jgi:hypothetical protein
MRCDVVCCGVVMPCDAMRCDAMRCDAMCGCRTVDGLLRVGVFAIQDIPANTEITFDYKFERFGSSKQK